MKSTLDYDAKIWHMYSAVDIQSIGTRSVTASLLTEAYGEYTPVDVYDFESAATAPYACIYIPHTDYPDVLKYGEFRIVRTNTYPDLIYVDCKSTLTTVRTDTPDPQHITRTGAEVFNTGELIYDINFLSLFEKDYIKEHIGAGGESILGERITINNIPIFELDEDNALDLTREDLYHGVAYRNGRFYQEPIDLEDPYADSSADDDGGNGSPDWNSDPITERALPPDFYGNSGLVQVYTPTLSELNAFASYIWSDNGLDLNDFKKIVNNPFDLVLGLSYIPFQVTIGGQRGVNVGNILSADTGLTMSYPSQENYAHSFGSLSIGEDEKAFIDYSPFTRVSIHLPFIGTQAIDIDLIRRNSKYNDTTIELKYKYNIVNGTVVAYLYTANQKVLYEWAGNVATPIPVASNDYTQTIAGLMSMAASAVSGAVTGAAIGSAVPGIGTAVGAIAGGVKGVASGGIDQVAALKPTITTTGSVGSSSALLTSTNDAFLIIEQPPLSIANQHRHYKGYPRNVSGVIKNSKGYNEICACRMSCELATGEELAEISEILQSGYIYGDVNGTVISKPTVDPGNNGFTVGLFQTSSSNIRIDKKCTLIEDYTTCTVKEDTSVITPTIILDANNEKAIKANYCYIPAYKRFYFIKDKRCLRGNLWEFDLVCDVLMSFRSDIIEHTVVFKKSESNWNLYLNDGSLQVDSRTRIKVKKFPNSLTNVGSYVLLLAGTQ